MAIKKPIVQESFTNEFGTVNVGDTVMAVTTGYSHNVSVRRATYLGYIESEGWNGKVEQKGGKATELFSDEADAFGHSDAPPPRV